MSDINSSPTNGTETVHCLTTKPGDDRVPPALKTAGAWSWRLIAVVIAVAGIGWVALRFTEIIIAMLVALLLAVVIEPMTSKLRNRWNWPPAAAAATGLLVLILFVVGLLYGSGRGIVSGFRDLSDQVRRGVNAIIEFITERFPDVGDSVDQAWDSLQAAISSNSSQILGGVASVGSSVTSFMTGFILALFALFFFLKDGRKLWHWMVRMTPVHYQNRVNEAGIRVWVTIGNYTRTQAIVAFVDAVGIALIAWILQTPLSLAFPIGVIVFLASFIPIVGALVSGFIAVIVVLVNTQSIPMALLMLGGILLVQQIEGNLLQPILQGNALNMHPLAIVLIVAGGTIVAGIAGALFSVPLAAAINAAVLYLRGHDIYPYLDSDQSRPGGPPRDFADYKHEYWAQFDADVAKHLPPREERKLKVKARKEKLRSLLGRAKTDAN